LIATADASEARESAVRTPLEEIEQAIERSRFMQGIPERTILAALYQARAIERLEATVRSRGLDHRSVRRPLVGATAGGHHRGDRGCLVAAMRSRVNSGDDTNRAHRLIRSKLWVGQVS